MIPAILTRRLRTLKGTHAQSAFSLMPACPCNRSLSCAGAFAARARYQGRRFFRQFEQIFECLIDDGGAEKCVCDLRVEDHDVRPYYDPLIELSSFKLLKVRTFVFRPHFIAFGVSYPVRAFTFDVSHLTYSSLGTMMAESSVQPHSIPRNRASYAATAFSIPINRSNILVLVAASYQAVNR